MLVMDEGIKDYLNLFFALAFPSLVDSADEEEGSKTREGMSIQIDNDQKNIADMDDEEFDEFSSSQDVLMEKICKVIKKEREEGVGDGHGAEEHEGKVVKDEVTEQDDEGAEMDKEEKSPSKVLGKQLEDEILDDAGTDNFDEAREEGELEEGELEDDGDKIDEIIGVGKFNLDLRL